MPRPVEEMWAADSASRRLGIELDEVGDGRARVRMTVAGWMLNGHGMCHGGYVGPYLFLFCRREIKTQVGDSFLSQFIGERYHEPIIHSGSCAVCQGNHTIRIIGRNELRRNFTN